VSVFSTTVLIVDSAISKQILWIEQKLVKNPNWREADQLAICKACWSWSGTTKHRSIQWHGGGFELGTFGLQIQRPNHKARLPPDEAITEKLLYWVINYGIVYCVFDFEVLVFFVVKLPDGSKSKLKRQWASLIHIFLIPFFFLPHTFYCCCSVVCTHTHKALLNVYIGRCT